jgi:hypothetical protein
MKIVIYRKVTPCWWKPWTWSGWRKSYGIAAMALALALLVGGCGLATLDELRARPPARTARLADQNHAVVARCVLDQLAAMGLRREGAEDSAGARA